MILITQNYICEISVILNDEHSSHIIKSLFHGISNYDTDTVKMSINNKHKIDTTNSLDITMDISDIKELRALLNTYLKSIDTAYSCILASV